MGRAELTRHHLTPKCIGRLWKIPYNTINSPDNIELLPNETHDRQDRVIPMLLERAQRQQAGIPVTIWQHHNEMLIYERNMKV